MTYPLIGNYGITDEDYETSVPSIGGMIVKENNDSPSNFRYTKTLAEVLDENNIPAMSGVDTRMLTRILRDANGLRAIITDISPRRQGGGSSHKSRQPNAHQPRQQGQLQETLVCPHRQL